MDKRQFEDMQRRGSVKWVDPSLERQQKARNISISILVGLIAGVVFASFWPHFSIVGFLLGGGFGYVLCYAAMTGDG